MAMYQFLNLEASAKALAKSAAILRLLLLLHQHLL